MQDLSSALQSGSAVGGGGWREVFGCRTAEEQLWGSRGGLGHGLGPRPWLEGGCLLQSLSGGTRGKGTGPEQHAALCGGGSGFPLGLQDVWMMLPRERISLISHSLAVFVP